MATVQQNEHFLANNAITLYDHDPGTTDATIVSPDGGTTKRYVDMRDFGNFTVVVMPTTTGGVTTVAIVAAVDDSGTDVQTIKTIASGVDADALADFIAGEVTAEQIAAVGAAAGKELRYASAVITSAAADEALVMFIRSEPKFAYSGLTATTIA